jgi:hypothetical protein
MYLSAVIPSRADGEGPHTEYWRQRKWVIRSTIRLRGKILGREEINLSLRNPSPSARFGMTMVAGRFTQKPVVIQRDPAIFPARDRPMRRDDLLTWPRRLGPNQRMRSRRSQLKNNSLKEESRACGIKQNAKSH